MMENGLLRMLLSLPLFGVLQKAPHTFGFNLDAIQPRIFTITEDSSYFGHRVCQLGPVNRESVLVTAPHHDHGTGGVYKCFYYSGLCSPVNLEVDHGIALGLSLTCDGDRAMVCGPRLSHDCGALRFLNGYCVELGPLTSQTLKPAFQECHDFGLDAVILFDDSQSISDADFVTMIKFIKNVVRMFTNPRSKVAVAQYSSHAFAVFHFDHFENERDPEKLLSNVPHTKGETYTPSAIRYVLEQMFTEKRGMRKESKKLLVVITDGKSNDREEFSPVISMADERGVIRYAIGVGKDYSREELEQIASSPKDVFEKDSFSALDSIRKQLQEKIFGIEGTDTSNFTSFQFELSQGGFSTAYTQDAVLFGAVGAFEWTGGIVREAQGANSIFINASALEQDMKDSYLGYSIAVAEVNDATLCFAGAPRYRHTGLVLAFQKDHGKWSVAHRIHGTQLGSYFGADLCVLYTSGKGWTGLLLLVGVPQYSSSGVGGEVRICSLESGPSFSTNCSLSLRGSAGNENGHFGASLSSCPDLNGDGVPELAVGAPMEDDGKGSLYIFLGSPMGIQTKYSQKVLGANMGHGLRYFGVSVHSSGDLTKDGLTDVVVGARGAAVILRTQPVMCVSVSVSQDPPIMPQDHFHCVVPHTPHATVSKATVCVTVAGVLTGNIKASLQAAVSISFELDAQTRPARLQLSPNSASSHWATNVTQTACYNLSISLPENTCITDYRAVPLSGQLSVQGLEIEGTGGLRPVMSPDCPSSFSHLILLEQVCGDDQVCVPDLKVTLNFTSVMVVSTPGYRVETLVVVSNSGEDASSIVLTMFYPSSLSFTHITQSSGKRSPRCVSNSTSFMNQTQTACHLSSTILRQGALTTVQMFFVVADPPALMDRLTMTVSVSSKNENTSTLEDNVDSCSVPVRLPVNIIIKEEGSTQYLSLPGNKLLEHTFKVENIGNLDIPVNVTFVVPGELHSNLLWNVSVPVVDSSRVQCVREGRLTHNDNSITLYQYCGGGYCHLIGCTIAWLKRNRPVSFHFAGHISGHIVNDVRVKAVSWGFLSFDLGKYTQFPLSRFHNRSIETVLEMPPVVRTDTIIAVSMLAGLLLLGIIFFILYKTGFFKTPNRMEDDGDPQQPNQESDQTSAPPCETET
ncbi:hypothetical protein AGOR_G00025900 [Albula goreensis]|uniref:VWFA domain-containing protein n=1 Tax=Albula goreensis TaxID=1534307 RepID=A0A8T3E1R6_9TELE|nr:hypothetical protein AGOR_G00025900 [Albula goreensis]